MCPLPRTRILRPASSSLVVVGDDDDGGDDGDDDGGDDGGAYLTRAEVEAGLPLERRLQLVCRSLLLYSRWFGGDEAGASGGGAGAAAAVLPPAFWESVKESGPA